MMIATMGRMVSATKTEKNVMMILDYVCSKFVVGIAIAFGMLPNTILLSAYLVQGRLKMQDQKDPATPKNDKRE